MVLLLTLLLPLCGSDCVATAAENPRNILFVFSWHNQLPWQMELERGIEEQFKAASSPPNLYFEYMDAGRFTGPRQVRVFREYLARKYANFPLDHVVFESLPAAKLLQTSPGLFKGIDTLVLNPGPSKESTFGSASVVPVTLDMVTSIRSALKLSRAKTVYLVGGATPGTVDRIREASDILAREAPGKKIVSLAGLPMDLLLKRVERLDRDGIILYLLLFQDGLGDKYIPYDAARQISEHANVPTYSFWTPLLGSGVVGGYMLSGEQTGREAAILLMNHKRNDVTDMASRFHGYYFDWRQLRRWNMDESGVPRDSTVLFKQPMFYEEHYLELGIFLVLGFLLVLTVRYRELKIYNREINSARKDLQSANLELGRVKNSLEEKNQLLRKLSVTDSLTGLFNRAYLDEKLHDEIDRIERYGDGLSVIMVDVDHFKEINDRYGHPVGDEVLSRIAVDLRENIRSIDTIGRWGGEEFMIICPNSDEHQSMLLAEKLREIVRSTEHPTVGIVTCSFGVASYAPGISEAKLIKDADNALYRSKNSGRDCVSSSSLVSSS